MYRTALLCSCCCCCTAVLAARPPFAMHQAAKQNHFWRSLLPLFAQVFCFVGCQRHAPPPGCAPAVLLVAHRSVTTKNNYSQAPILVRADRFQKGVIKGGVYMSGKKNWQHTTCVPFEAAGPPQTMPSTRCLFLFCGVMSAAAQAHGAVAACWAARPHSVEHTGGCAGAVVVDDYDCSSSRSGTEVCTCAPFFLGPVGPMVHAHLRVKGVMQEGRGRGPPPFCPIPAPSAVLEAPRQHRRQSRFHDAHQRQVVPARKDG